MISKEPTSMTQGLEKFCFCAIGPSNDRLGLFIHKCSVGAINGDRIPLRNA